MFAAHKVLYKLNKNSHLRTKSRFKYGFVLHKMNIHLLHKRRYQFIFSLHPLARILYLYAFSQLPHPRSCTHTHRIITFFVCYSISINTRYRKILSKKWLNYTYNHLQPAYTNLLALYQWHLRLTHLCVYLWNEKIMFSYGECSMP